MPPASDQSQYREAARLWQESRYPIAFTGAGISVASGIPDFRSPGGLWSKYDPMKVATAEALLNNPKGVWEFLLDTVDLFDQCGPNPAHVALARLETEDKLQGIITQNVDNLHQRAGSCCVVEYHGNFQRFFCQKCRKSEPLDQVGQVSSDRIPPYCETCGGLIRPDVVFFGEAIPTEALQHSRDLLRKADLILIIGTSGEVAPANTIPHQIKRNGGSVIEINLGSTLYNNITDVRFDAPVEEVLPRFAEQVLSGQSA